MEALIERIRSTPGCRVLPPLGPPAVGSTRDLPSDLVEFYRLCGGAELFTRALFPVRVSAPGELLPSNQVILGERFEHDLSDSWYIIAHGGGDEYISIDLDPSRSGRCYDSFYDIHGVAGSQQVIALSFTDLIERLITAQGGHWYWLEPEFSGLGDAYDGV